MYLRITVCSFVVYNKVVFSWNTTKTHLNTEAGLRRHLLDNLDKKNLEEGKPLKT